MLAIDEFEKTRRSDDLVIALRWLTAEINRIKTWRKEDDYVERKLYTEGVTAVFDKIKVLTEEQVEIRDDITTVNSALGLGLDKQLETLRIFDDRTKEILDILNHLSPRVKALEEHAESIQDGIDRSYRPGPRQFLTHVFTKEYSIPEDWEILGLYPLESWQVGFKGSSLIEVPGEYYIEYKVSFLSLDVPAKHSFIIAINGTPRDTSIGVWNTEAILREPLIGTHTENLKKGDRVELWCMGTCDIRLFGASLLIQGKQRS